jgi:hypothetical protein
MNDDEKDKLRAVLERWITEAPKDYEMTRRELREHPNEITVGSQTGMRKVNQYALACSDINFKLRLITLRDTKPQRSARHPGTYCRSYEVTPETRRQGVYYQ